MRFPVKKKAKLHTLNSAEPQNIWIHQMRLMLMRFLGKMKQFAAQFCNTLSCNRIPLSKQNWFEQMQLQLRIAQRSGSVKRRILYVMLKIAYTHTYAHRHAPLHAHALHSLNKRKKNRFAQWGTHERVPAVRKKHAQQMVNIVENTTETSQQCAYESHPNSTSTRSSLVVCQFVAALLVVALLVVVVVLLFFFCCLFKFYFVCMNYI